MSQANAEIRAAVKAAGLKLWQIADHIGIADTTMSKYLRKELSPELREKVLAAIRELKEAN